jgi:ferredoxin
MTKQQGQQLRVDWILCDGYSLCADFIPEVIDLDEWGYPIIQPGPIHPSLLKDARKAVDSCPMRALILEPIPSERR